MFDVLDRILSSAYGILSIIICFYPGLKLDQKLIIFLALTCLCLIVSCVRLNNKNKRIAETLEKTNDKHKALASQFDKQRTQIKHYESAFDTLEMVLTAASLSTTKEKMSKLLAAFLHIKNELLGGYDDERRHRE